MKRIPFAALAAPLALLSAVTPAAAQDRELDPEAVQAAARYALPLAFDGYVTRCSAELDPSGYVASNTDNLSAKFSDGAGESWPAAKVLMMNIAREEAGEMTAIFDMLDDESLRPFVDGMIQGIVAQEMKVEECGTVERALEILDPMPADNVAALAGFLFEMGMRADAEPEAADGNDAQ